MNINSFPVKLFESDDNQSEELSLILGCEPSLLKKAPTKAICIDPSISTVKKYGSLHQDKTFLTQDLSTFSLPQKFRYILSLNTLQFEYNLKKVFQSLEKHLLEETYLYFPLSINDKLKQFLKQTDGISFSSRRGKFVLRERQDVEDAILSTNFSSIQLTEQTEDLCFYSQKSLEDFLSPHIQSLLDISEEDAETLSCKCASFLYKEQDPDKVFIYSYPWIMIWGEK